MQKSYGNMMIRKGIPYHHLDMIQKGQFNLEQFVVVHNSVTQIIVTSIHSNVSDMAYANV